MYIYINTMQEISTLLHSLSTRNNMRLLALVTIWITAVAGESILNIFIQALKVNEISLNKIKLTNFLKINEPCSNILYAFIQNEGIPSQVPKIVLVLLVPLSNIILIVLLSSCPFQSSEHYCQWTNHH